MTWTYVVANLATSNLYQVRRLVGDVNATDQQLQDEEINWYLTAEGGVYQAAIACAEAIASGYARKADRVVGNLRVQASQQAKAYYDLAKSLRRRMAIHGITPFAGGISVSDKETREEDDDRVVPIFTRSMQEAPATSLQDFHSEEEEGDDE